MSIRARLKRGGALLMCIAAGAYLGACSVGGGGASVYAGLSGVSVYTPAGDFWAGPYSAGFDFP